MRNTFVKLFLALAVCFMIGSALVACGSATFELSVIDGEFAINGEKTGIKQGDSVEECAHEVKEFEVKAHTKDADGVILEVCTKCDDYAKVKPGTIHNYVDTEIAATCTTTGFKGGICTICGGEDAQNGEKIPVKEHDWSEQIILTVANKYACTKGGVAVKNCDACGFVSDPVAVDAVGHVAENWSVSGLSETQGAEAKGNCIYCEEVVVYDIPYLNDEDYTYTWKDGKAATCDTKGTKLYTYIVKDEPNADNVWGTNLDVAVKDWAGREDTADHVLAGKSYFEWENAAGDFMFYADKDEDGKVEPVGFKEYAITAAYSYGPIECKTTAAGYFTCEACNYVVHVPNIYKEHYGAETITKAATCYQLGTKSVDCVNCKDTVSYEYSTEHNYVYTLEKKAGYAENKFDLIGKCDAIVTYKDAAGKTQTVKCSERVVGQLEKTQEEFDKAVAAGLYGSSKELGIVAVDTKMGEDATCYAYGYDVYRYVKDGKNIDAKIYHDNNDDKVIDKNDLVPHTLDGKTVDEYEDGLKTNIPGILPLGGTKFTTCGTTYAVVYECSVCAAYKAASGEDIGTYVYATAEMPHAEVIYTVAEGDNPTKAPTCVTPGVEYFKCLNEGCTLAKGQPREVDALGHDYVLNYSVDARTLEITVKGVCSRDCEDCDTEIEKTVALNTLEGNKNKVEGTAATCISSKIDKYSFYLSVVASVANRGVEDAEVVNVSLEIVTKDKKSGDYFNLDGDEVDEETVIPVSYSLVDVAKIAHNFNYTEAEKKELTKVVYYDVVDEETEEVVKYVAFMLPCKVCGTFEQYGPSMLLEDYLKTLEQ